MAFHPDQGPSHLGPLRNEAPADDGSATRLSRLGAALIDMVISVILTLPILFYSGALDDFSATAQREFPQALIWSAVGAAVWLAANSVLLTRSAQTIGKMLLGIQVVNVSDGKPAAFSRLVVWRFLPTLLVPLLPYVGDLLAFLDVAFIFRKDGRCLHDHLAGTRVVAVR
jgi:uncharacterized RDD family membrane protein YckC